MFSRAKTVAAFVVGGVVGAMAAEAAMCMADPCLRRKIRRTGRQAVRFAQRMSDKML